MMDLSLICTEYGKHYFYSMFLNAHILTSGTMYIGNIGDLLFVVKSRNIECFLINHTCKLQYPIR